MMISFPKALMVSVFSILLLYSYTEVKSLDNLLMGLEQVARGKYIGDMVRLFCSLFHPFSSHLSFSVTFLPHLFAVFLCYLSHSSNHLKDSLTIGSLHLSKVLNSSPLHSLSVLHGRHERQNPSQPGNVFTDQKVWYSS
jgi:hypothetical protein